MNINIIGVANTLSYGVVTKNIIKALINAGHSVHFHPLYKPEYSESEKFIETALETPFHKDAPQVLIWHQYALNQFLDGGGKKIGFSIFELDTLTPHEVFSMNSCDELIVCSKWAKQICLNNLIKKPIHVVPLGVDRDVFHSCPFPKLDKFTISFYNKWEIRKGHDNIPEILSHFSNHLADFKLNVCCDNPLYTQKENQEWKDFYIRTLGDKVEFFNRFESQKDLVSFIANSHVGLFPSKAEGWNLPVLEYMSVGRKVVTTNYSAMTEFCDDKNSNLVEITGYEPALDGKWFFGQGSWATYNNKSFAYELYKIYSEYLNKELMFNEYGTRTAMKYSWDNTAVRLIESVNFI